MADSPSLSNLKYDELSSPDPLGTSFDGEHVSSHPRTSTPFKRGQSSSPKKSNFTTQEMRFAVAQSPSRTNPKMGLSPSRTISEQTLSPWKIRVTVEAEPEDMESCANTMTRTVKIPLREESSPTQPENRRERCRNTQTGQARKKRSGTPVRGRRESCSRRPSVTDLDITVLGDDAEGDEWTQKKSPRKRKPSQTRKKKTVETSETGSGLSLSERRGKHKSTESAFEIHEDADAENELLGEQAFDTESPELRQIDLNRVFVRSRSWSTNQQDAVQTDSIQSKENINQAPKSVQSMRKVSSLSAATYPTPSPSSSYHGNSDEQQKPPDTVQEPENDFSVLESEGFTMIDLDSIPSARNFLSSPLEDAQVLPLSKGSSAHHESEDQPITDSIHQKAPTQISEPYKNPSYPTFPEGDSDISSTVPSSPPIRSSELLQAPLYKIVDQTRKVTPSIDSSPILPPIPRVVRKTPSFQGHKHKISAGVVSTGIALQNALSSDSKEPNTRQKEPEQEVATPREELDHLFDGFDSGTKRELRAGLRFGEELARRQKSDNGSHSTDEATALAKSSKTGQINTAQGEYPINFGTQVWRGETIVTRSPAVSNLLDEKIPVVTEKDTYTRMKQCSQSTKSRVSMDDSLGTTTDESNTKNPAHLALDQSMLNTQVRRDYRYKIEREAVSREIQNADPNHVVTIYSDSEEADEAKDIPDANTGIANGRTSRIENRTNDESGLQDDGDEDVWLAEAHDTSNSDRQQDEHDLFTRSEQRRQRERAREVISKPRRTLIPSPWKRGEDMAESTVLTEGDMSGMLWQQTDDKLKFGSGEIARQRRELSGKFDIDRMARPTSRSESFMVSPLDHQTTEDAIASQSGEDDDGTRGNSDISDSGLDDTEQSHTEDMASVSRSVDFPVKVPVNFNDSSIATDVSGALYTPPRELEQVLRPGTPRSAMKGARLSLGLEDTGILSPAKRVIFSKRHRRMDEDGVEESISADLSSPTFIHIDIVPQPDTEIVKVVEDLDEPQEQNAKPSGWLSWLWKAKPDDNPQPKEPTVHNTPNAMDGSNDQDDEGQWQATKSSIPSTSAWRMNSSKSTASTKTKVPSYLRPPSYPSDPNRDPSIPLALLGDFTNTHFRTLHIIWRKSQRPKFHSPKSVRPSLARLLGMKIVIDEHDAKLGSFEWKCGRPEIQVLERFMQEVEFGYQHDNDDDGDDNAINDCEWGWQTEDLARWLCRIVVGEIIRDEEGGRKTNS